MINLYIVGKSSLFVWAFETRIVQNPDRDDDFIAFHRRRPIWGR